MAAAVGVDRDRLATARQVHGSGIVVATGNGAGPSWSGTPPDGDIIIAGPGASALAVQTADCVPLLLADRGGRAVAAVHAGWRGLAAKAPAEAVRALAHTFGVEPCDLIVAMGPAIGACCYQVGREVREAFTAAFGDAETVRWFSPAPARLAANPPMPHVPAEPTIGRWFFDAWACARAQLETAGVDGGRIFSASLCTASHAEVFCSYRRDGKPSGRMAAVIRGRQRVA